MDLQSLLGEMPKQSFAENIFHRFPYSLAGTAQSYLELGTWDIVAKILTSDGADTMVVRDGARYNGPAPANMEAAQSLSNEGYTILARHAERHSDRLHEVAGNFQRDFCSPVDVHVYATPPGQHGFGWHYDAEDVFIVQTAGCKQYSLRKNTVHPWPVVETLPTDMVYEREIMPLMRVTLAAGDWLYIPCGYWHKADSVGTETSISLAIGVLSPAAITVYDFIRTHALQSLLWRQKLPMQGDASPLTKEKRFELLRDLFHQLGDDLQKTFHDERLIRSFADRELGI